MKNLIQKNSKNPILIHGAISVDDRGEVSFVNDFEMNLVKRFYTVNNHKSRTIRAWHGHKKEKKFVSVIKGAAILAAVKIDNWGNPSKDLYVNRYVLSEKNPSILFIPSGYANGFMTLTEDAKLIFFSSATLKESEMDDYRYVSDFWDPWSILER